MTPLLKAALGRHLEVVKYLRAHGARPDIFAAVLLEDAETMALLLKQEPRSVNLTAPNGETPLLLAAELRNEPLVRQLLEADADASVHAPQLCVGGAAELAEYKHHATIAALIRQWSQKNASLIPRPSARERAAAPHKAYWSAQAFFSISSRATAKSFGAFCA